MGWTGLIRMYGLNESEGEKLAELVGAPSIMAVREMIRDNLQCQNGYTLPAVAAPIYLFHAKEWHADAIPRSREEHALKDLGWSQFGLELALVVMVEGDHLSMFTCLETSRHIDALFGPDSGPDCRIRPFNCGRLLSTVSSFQTARR